VATVNNNLLVTGNVGVGTNTPSNKISISTTGANTGLHLPNGASSGKVLTSDTQGNAVWVSGAVQYQTMVTGDGGTTIYTGTLGGANVKINFFTNVLFDKAKDIYGNTYGWDTTNQQYVAPVTGIYRVAFNIYFQSTEVGGNPRVYVFKNGVFFQDPGFVSVTDTGMDQSNFVMGLVSLNAGDIIDFRVMKIHGSSPDVALWGGLGHTYIIIESL
ncbi:hypothetical protein, partial [Dysgonomonas macrotermitis]